MVDGKLPNELSYPLECSIRQLNFTATVTDSKGRKCRNTISTKACFGSCDTFEVIFIQSSSLCSLKQ